MFLHDPPKRATRKELKVEIPPRHRRALRDHQAATGDDAGTIVCRALAFYFQRLARERAPRLAEAIAR